jgi:hypothetical protein
MLACIPTQTILLAVAQTTKGYQGIIDSRFLEVSNDSWRSCITAARIEQLATLMAGPTDLWSSGMVAIAIKNEGTSLW